MKNLIKLDNDKNSDALTVAAKNIRQELKAAFKGVKFSVRTSRFSMGDSISVSWKNGPKAEDVEEIADKYQKGRFDGMQDMYEYSNAEFNNVHGGTKYVSCNRELSENLREEVTELIRERYTDAANSYHVEQTAGRLLYKTYIPEGAELKGLKDTDVRCGSFEDMYYLDFDTTQGSKTTCKSKNSSTRSLGW
jgi:hypothetical protein